MRSGGASNMEAIRAGSRNGKRIKILFLIDSLEPGGTERQLMLLAERLPRQTFEPLIGVLRGSPFLASLSLKTPIVNFNWRGVKVIKHFALVAKLHRFIRRNHFDIVQTHFIDSSIYGSLAVRLSRDKPFLVGTRRNLYYWIKDLPFSFAVYNYTSRWSDRILVNSHSIYDKCRELENIPNTKIELIENGVEVGRFREVSSEAAKEKVGLAGRYPVVGVVANFRPVKGLTDFLQAAARVHREFPGSRFVLVGNGPQRQELLELAGKMGVAPATTFLGHSTKISDIIPAFDVAVQSSISESFSNVLIEYMAAQRPIVATRVGDAERIIVSGKDGLLVSPGSERELGEAILSLVRNPEEAAAIARRAREKVEDNWEFTKILERYQSFYQELVGARP
jgi:glycosyltransferase involved in cell wall biosynthesis